MSQMPFDNEKYKQLQKADIFSRIQKFDKLYIEVGGKLFDDCHAARVLPGFDPNVKMQIFSELSNDLEVIFCVSAKHIVNGRKRSDNGLTYGEEIFRLCECMKSQNISVCGIMINFYLNHPLITEFEQVCKNKNLKTYRSFYIHQYPNNTNAIISNAGFGKNDHIKTSKKIVLVSAPGANSGKLEVCLSQLYNDKIHGIKSGYAKYETFPVHNLSLDHLVNIAYESATAEIDDHNMIDPFFKLKTKKDSVNYNRDVEAFPILSNILKQILGEELYGSPTEMGINNVGNAIVDDKAVQKAAFEEIKRRFENHKALFENYEVSEKTYNRIQELYEKAKRLIKNI